MFSTEILDVFFNLEEVINGGILQMDVILLKSLQREKVKDLESQCPYYSQKQDRSLGRARETPYF